MQRRNKISHDISIEEMLKSIRGIINTHQQPKLKDEEDILELTEIVNHNKKEDETLNNHHINNDNDNLISSSVVNESIENIKNLTKHAKDSLIFEKKVSAEDLLIQLLKPQLKEWLDKNLPHIIEQMLEKEIKKLIPKNKEF